MKQLLFSIMIALLLNACGGKSSDTPPQKPTPEASSSTVITAGDDRNILEGGKAHLAISILGEGKTIVSQSWKMDDKILSTQAEFDTEVLPVGKHLITLDAVDSTGKHYLDSLYVYVKKPTQNTRPYANDVTKTIKEDTVLRTTVSGGDVDGDAIEFVFVQFPKHGILSGSTVHLVYTPKPNFYGTDTFQYKVNDGTNDSRIATFTVHVTAVNDAPVANNQNTNTDEGKDINITLTASDIENDNVTFSIKNSPEGKLTVLNSTTFTYTPTSTGKTDSFTFVANDGNLDSEEATVSIKIVRPFKLTYDTNSSQTIKVPVYSTKGKTFKIDWGDGSSDSYTNKEISFMTPVIPLPEHTYTDNNPTHQISIYNIIAIRHWNNGVLSNEKNQLLSVDQWGDTKWKTMYAAFDHCPNLTLKTTDKPDLSQVTNLDFMFRATAINSNINDWDVSTIDDMQGLFQNAKNFNQPLHNWNVSNVTTMMNMFQGASAFNQDISDWNVSNISGQYTMEGMLYSTSYTTSNYDNLLKAWSKLTYNTNNPINFGIPSFYTVKKAHDTLEVKGWNFTDLGFQPKPFIVTVHIPTNDGNFTIGADSSFNYFVDCDSDGTFEVQNQKDTYTCHYQNAGDYNISITGIYPQIKFQANPEKVLAVQQWGGIKWKSMNSAFRGVPNLQLLATDTPDLSQVTDMSWMFARSIGGSVPIQFNGDISDWNVSNVKDMSFMFYLATQFNQDLKKWDVSNVENMYDMFYYATNFNQDISSWKITSISSSGAMQGFLSHSGLSQQNYDKLLNSWSTQTLQPGVSIGAIGLMASDLTAINKFKQKGWFVRDNTPRHFTIAGVYDTYILEGELYTASAQVIGDSPAGTITWGIDNSNDFTMDTNGTIHLDAKSITNNNDANDDTYMVTLTVKDPARDNGQTIINTASKTIRIHIAKRLKLDKSSFTLTNGIVTDSTTGLQWEDENHEGNWTTALQTCNTSAFAGFTDWRLPSLDELKTLMDFNYTKTDSPTYLADIFVNRPNKDMWTSTLRNTYYDYEHPYYPYYIDFSNSQINGNGSNKFSNNFYCVRGTALINKPNLQVNTGFQIVTDNTNNLEWQDNEVTSHNFTEGVSYCQNLNLNGSGWRVPTFEEITSIYPVQTNILGAFTLLSTATISPLFTTKGGNGYNMSNTQANNDYSVLTVDYPNYGRIYTQAKTRQLYLRCVRDVQ